MNKLYTVYHLPQLEKVGATNDFERRMKEQGVEPLDKYKKSVHDTIEEASLAEETLREYYGYKKDSLQTYAQKLSKPSNLRKFIRNGHTVGLNVGLKSLEELKTYLSKGPITFGLKNGTFIIQTEAQIDKLISTVKKSQYPGGDFYWNSIQIKEAYDATTINNVTAIHSTGAASIVEFEKIRVWATSKGIYTSGDPKTQYIKLQEECGELAKAILDKDEPEIEDALGDILVVLISVAHLAGYRLEDCLDSAYNVIAKRTGKMVNGTFIKDQS